MSQLHPAARPPFEVDPRLSQLAEFWAERLDRLERRHERRPPIGRRLSGALVALAVHLNNLGEPGDAAALQARSHQLRIAEIEYDEVLARFTLHSG